MGEIRMNNAKSNSKMAIMTSLLILTFILTSLIPLKAISTESSYPPVFESSRSDDQNLLKPIWWNLFGGEKSDKGYFIDSTSDGGYIVVGSTNSFGAQLTDLWVIKFDGNGQEQWYRTYGGIGYDTGEIIQQASDGGYAILGSIRSFSNGNSDVWLLKINANGTKEWEKTFGGIEMDYGKSLRQTGDGGYIITGSTKSFGNGNYDAWLIKTDITGSEQWNRTFGGIKEDVGKSIELTSDGGYIIVGHTDSTGSGAYDVWMIKTNDNGIEQWNQTFGGDDWEMGDFVLQTSDGGYVISGYTRSMESGNADVWLIKTNSTGVEIWNKTFGNLSYERCKNLLQIPEGGFIMVGHTTANVNESYDILLIKTDDKGNEVWQKTFGWYGDEFGYGIRQTADDGYMIVGSTDSFSTLYSDLLLLKVDSNGSSEEDNNRPWCFIESPTNQDNIFKTVTVKGSANDTENSLEKIEVKIDNGKWYTASGTETWYYTLDTTNFVDSEHIIYFRAYDGQLYSLIDYITVNIDNADKYNQIPTCTFKSPLNFTTISGTKTITGTAYDTDGTIKEVELKIDNESWFRISGTELWSYSLDTTELTNGKHIIYARSYDGMSYSNLKNSTITVFVNNTKSSTSDENGDFLFNWVFVTILVGIIGLFTIICFSIIKKKPVKAEQKSDPRVPIPSTMSKRK